MPKTAVIYASKYGTTKQYAQWISEELGAELLDARRIKPAQLQAYERVIFGGALYMGGIRGVKLVMKNPCPSLVVFTVGLVNPKATDYSAVLERNGLIGTTVFHFRGGIDYGKLGPWHRMVTAMLKRFAPKGRELFEGHSEFMASYGKRVSYVERSSIEPLVRWARAVKPGSDI